LGRYLSAIRTKLDDALRKHHTPKQVAGSFALGVFITSLPTLGVGVLLFFVVVSVSASVSKVAIFASVLVLNPAVKWSVYGLSFWIGTVLVGPLNTASVFEISLSVTPDVLFRLLLGNLVVATVLSVVAYAVAHRFTVKYRRRRGADRTDHAETNHAETVADQ